MSETMWHLDSLVTATHLIRALATLSLARFRRVCGELTKLALHSIKSRDHVQLYGTKSMHQTHITGYNLFTVCHSSFERARVATPGINRVHGNALIGHLSPSCSSSIRLHG